MIWLKRLRRRYRWWRTNGARRLRAARLRRAGKPVEAFVLLAGARVLVSTIIEVPDVYRRMRLIKQVTRRLCLSDNGRSRLQEAKR